MQYIKTFEQFNINQYSEMELSEKMALFGGDPEKKKGEIKKMLEPLNLPTLKNFVNIVLEKDKLTPARLLEVLKRVFGMDNYYKKYSWTANREKYAIFKQVSEEAVKTNTDAAWHKAISLLNFGMKYATEVAAFPVWNEDKKEWTSGSLPGKQR